MGHRCGAAGNRVEDLSWARSGLAMILQQISIGSERGRVFLPATGCRLARGVAPGSATLEACLGGELMIMPSFDRWDGCWGVDFAGEDWKKRGDDEATAEPFLRCEPLGVGCEG